MMSWQVVGSGKRGQVPSGSLSELTQSVAPRARAASNFFGLMSCPGMRPIDRRGGSGWARSSCVGMCERGPLDWCSDWEHGCEP